MNPVPQTTAHIAYLQRLDGPARADGEGIRISARPQSRASLRIGGIGVHERASQRGRSNVAKEAMPGQQLLTAAYRRGAPIAYSLCGDASGLALHLGSFSSGG